MQGGCHGIVANGLLKAPKDSQLIKDLVNVSKNFNKKEITWGEIGPNLLTEKIREYKLERYIQEVRVFYPVNYWEWKDLFLPESFNAVMRASQRSHTIQIWHQMLNRKGFDNNNFLDGSAMDYFYKKYVSNQ
jgi:hypothetical protein